MPPPTEAELESATPGQLLVLAAELGRTDLVVSALRAGAEVNALVPLKDASGSRAALHAALSNGHVDATRALLAAGASLSARDSSSNTPVSLASTAELKATLCAHVCQRVAAGDLSTIQDAAAAGLDLSSHDGTNSRNSPLHWAASFGQVESVIALLAAGAAPDVRNAKGDTPLRDAAAAGHVPVVRVLVAAGADPSIKGMDGMCAADVAANDEVLGALHRAAEPEVPALPAVDEVTAEMPATPATPYFVPGERGSGGMTAMGEKMPEWASLLWPRPQRFVEGRGVFTVPPIVTISAENQCMSVGRLLKNWLVEALPIAEYSVRLVGGGQGGLGEAIAFSACVFLRVDDHGLERSEQAYHLTVRDFGIDVVGANLAGVFYGCCTLLDVLKLRISRKSDDAAPLTVPTLSASDWPSVRRRGLHLDVSGRRLPKMSTLIRLVSFLAKTMKMNQLHLKVGENFERLDTTSGNIRLKHEDMLELSRVCAEHFVELIPVVSEPTAMHRRLEDLHIAPNGGSKENPEEASRKKAKERELLYDEFLPLFDTEQVNLGDPCKQTTCELTDFEELRNNARSLRSRGKRTVLVFGNKIKDVLTSSSMTSGASAELPTRSILIMETEGFERRKLLDACLQLRQFGVSFYTCCSSYLEDSFSGRTSSCLSSCRIAVDTAVEQGAAGVLLKDISAVTEGAPLVFLHQALIPFGGASWNSKSSIEMGSSGPEDLLSRLYDRYLFNDPVDKGILGSIAVSLGDLHRIAGDMNGDALFYLLGQREDEVRAALENLSYPGLRRALKRAERIENALASYNGNANVLDVSELRVSAILLGASARLGAWLLSLSSANSMDSTRSAQESNSDITGLPDGRRSDLCNALLQGIELLRSAWVSRYQEHGFTATIERLTGEALSKLASGMPYQRYLEDRKAEGWAPTDES